MKVAFASCAKIQWFPDQPAWGKIEAENPDYLLLLGDNVYAPNNHLDLAELEQRYKEQAEEPHFKQLVANPSVKVHAIWDDHDFGEDNMLGAELDDGAYKNAARDLFFDNMLFGQRDRTKVKEVYHAFEDEATDVKFIMLDVRLYRQSPGRAKTILGKDQEDWLEMQLSESNHEITVICSGSNLQGRRQVQPWEKYTEYYERFTGMLKEKGKCLFLSGDIHKNAFNRHDGFFEAISSGVGRSGVWVSDPSQNRHNYGMIEFGGDTVEFGFRGVRSRDRFEVTIDRNSWEIIRDTRGAGKD